MRRLVCLLLDKVCATTGHAGGCWILNESPLRHLWYWSSGIAIKLETRNASPEKDVR